MSDVPRVSSGTIVELVETLALARAEAIVLLATDLPTVSVIGTLETRFALPVLTSNQTLLWHGLRLCGNRADIPNLGRIFQS